MNEKKKNLTKLKLLTVNKPTRQTVQPLTMFSNKPLKWILPAASSSGPNHMDLMVCQNSGQNVKPAYSCPDKPICYLVIHLMKLRHHKTNDSTTYAGTTYDKTVGDFIFLLNFTFKLNPKVWF